MKKLLTIEGMSCGHCVMHVKNALSELGGVKDVAVDLQQKSAVVEGDALDDQAMKAAVADAGYQVTAVAAL